MSYPAPPPAEQPPARQTASTSAAAGGSFFNDLFDFRFTRFVSLRLISIVYILILVGASLFFLFLIFAGFATQNAALGLFVLIFSIIGWFLVVIVWRVSLEAFAVLFRIHDDTSRMAHGLAGQGGSGFAPPAPSFGGSQPPASDFGGGTTQVQQYPYSQGGGYQQSGYTTPPPAAPAAPPTTPNDPNEPNNPPPWQ